MGYGPVTPGGKQLPITPYEGSWAWEQEQRRSGERRCSGLQPTPKSNKADAGQWPMGYPTNPLQFKEKR